MIIVDRPGAHFSVRVAGVAVQNGAVLLQSAPDVAFWTLPGGRLEINETAEEALAREMREEIGSDVRVGRLLWIVENFFEFRKRRCHELDFYFEMALPEASSVAPQDRRHIAFDSGMEICFEWRRMQELGGITIYPEFLAVALAEPLPAHTTHIVVR